VRLTPRDHRRAGSPPANEPAVRDAIHSSSAHAVPCNRVWSLSHALRREPVAVAVAVRPETRTHAGSQTKRGLLIASRSRQTTLSCLPVTPSGRRSGSLPSHSALLPTSPVRQPPAPLYTYLAPPTTARWPMLLHSPAHRQQPHPPSLVPSPARLLPHRCLQRPAPPAVAVHACQPCRTL
jgi:hypothetical protein